MPKQRIKIGDEKYKVKIGSGGNIKKVFGEPDATIRNKSGDRSVIKLGGEKHKFRVGSGGNLKSGWGGGGGDNKGGGSRTQIVKQDSPLGTQKFRIKLDKDGNIKRVVDKTELSGSQQTLLNKEEALGKKALNATSDQLRRVNQVMKSDVPKANDRVRRRTEDALYERATSRLDPRFDDMRRDLENRLVNQGFARGSEAYADELEDFGRTQTDAYQAAMNEAIAGGGVEQSRLLQDELAVRGVPFNELAAVSGLAGEATMPQFGTLGAEALTGQNLLNKQAQTEFGLQAANQAFQGNLQDEQRKSSFWDSIFNVAGDAFGGWLGSR